MENQVLATFAQSTVNVFVFGVLIGSLFSIAVLAIFDAIKAARANCGNGDCSMDKPAPVRTAPKPAAKPAAKAVAKPASKKVVAKKPAAKKAVAKKAPAKKKK